MNKESIAVELTASEVYIVSALANLMYILYKIQNGPGPRSSLFKKLELKMLKALDAVKVTK